MVFGLAWTAGTLPVPAAAQQPLVLTDVAGTDGEGGYALGPHLTYLRDTQQRTLEEVAALPDAFQSGRGEALRFGYDEAAYWACFTLIDRSVPPVPLWVLEVGQKSIDHVDVYVAEPGGGFVHQVSGDGIPYTARPVEDRNLIFPITMERGVPQTVYVRVASQGPVSLPLTIWSAEAYNSRVQLEQLAFGIFFGGLLIIAIYNLLLFLSIRDVAFLYYVLFLLSFLAHELAVDRFAFAYVWPEQLWWHARANSVLALLSGIFGLQFARVYLDARHYAPRVDRFLQGLIGFSILVIGVLLVHVDAFINQSVALFMMLVVAAALAAGVVCWRRGNRAARFYLLAWGILLVAVLVGLLSYFGVLPGDVWIIVRIGALLEAILLSLGLGDRFRLLQRAREHLQWQIAEDLHDDIGGELAQVAGVALMMRRAARRLQEQAEAITAQVQALRMSEPQPSGVAEDPGTAHLHEVGSQHRDLAGQVEAQAEQVGDMARSITGKMRDIVWAIKPHQESWADLEAYVREAAQGLLGPRDIAFVMEGEAQGDPPPLPLDVRHHLVLIIKEAITNAARHAACSQVTLTYRFTEERLWLRVSDDGQGFDPEQVERGNGLDNLARRAEAIQADLHVASQPGGPTQIEIDVPMQPSHRVPTYPNW